MDSFKYKKIVKKYTKKNNYIHNYLVASISGGVIGALAQIVYIFLKNVFSLSGNISKSYVTLVVILISSFLTAIGVFDNFIVKFRSGLIIPTTGFAHSVTSSAIDARGEGLIKGLGCNFFHLAGSVILYSIVTSFILVLVRVIIFA